MTVIKEFKEFISRGNVIDMAVGVVIGSAFTSIVTSLNRDILTPFISFITGKVNISSLEFVVNDDLKFSYGMFLQSVINFLLTAIAVFILVKSINVIRKKMEALAHKKAEAEAAVKPKLTVEQELLTEIRDLLKDRDSVKYEDGLKK